MRNKNLRPVKYRDYDPGEDEKEWFSGKFHDWQKEVSESGSEYFSALIEDDVTGVVFSCDQDKFHFDIEKEAFINQQTSEYRKVEYTTDSMYIYKENDLNFEQLPNPNLKYFDGYFHGWSKSIDQSGEYMKAWVENIKTGEMILVYPSSLKFK